MSEDVVIGAAMGAALVLIMFSMGLVLTMQDFLRVVKRPRSVFLGVVAQLVVLPLVALGSVYALDITSAAMIGILVVAICPGGPVSNFFAYISRGDAALSVTLTLASTVLSLITLPALFAWTPLGGFADSAETPAAFVLKSMLIGVLTPIAVGMAVRAQCPQRAAVMARHLEKGGLALIFVVLCLLLYKNRAFLADITATLLIAAMLVNVGGMVGGYLLGSATRQPRPTRITYSFEVGLQNVPLASVLAYGLFSSDGLSRTIVLAVIGLYAVVSILSALVALVLFRQARQIVPGDVRVSENP